MIQFTCACILCVVLRLCMHMLITVFTLRNCCQLLNCRTTSFHTLMKLYHQNIVPNYYQLVTCCRFSMSCDHFHQMISDDDWYNTLWELTCVPPRNTINPGICVEKRLDIARPESPRYGPNRSGISLWANGVCKYTIYQHTVWKPLVFTPNAVETQDTRKFIYASIHWNLLLL